ncbi:MAG: ketoacyl-ACP synthase III [Legionellaceae bacterium]|nr:ketoacyl-ACP synthase III [Legionellaceae bacterium]
MIYLDTIGYYLPPNEVSNYSKVEKFAVKDDFLLQKIGITSLRVKNADEDTSDMCVKAYLDMLTKTNVSSDDIDCLIVCTQNPDGYGLPHTSAIVHSKLGLKQNCAVFDISLGCSGYVYGLSIAQSFMMTNGFNNGVFITADPYSKIIDEDDKNSTFLFSDAATATLLTRSKHNTWQMGHFLFGSDGSKYESIRVDDVRHKFKMNGREVVNFAAKIIPAHIHQLLQKNKLSIDDIDRFIFHQGSKFIISTIQQKLGLSDDKVPFLVKDYGNTVSSSIPLILKDLKKTHHPIVICGFGVGLSWGSCVLKLAE